MGGAPAGLGFVRGRGTRVNGGGAFPFETVSAKGPGFNCPLTLWVFFPLVLFWPPCGLAGFSSRGSPPLVPHRLSRSCLPSASLLPRRLSPIGPFLPAWCLPGASQAAQLVLSCLPGASQAAPVRVWWVTPVIRQVLLGLGSLPPGPSAF